MAIQNFEDIEAWKEARTLVKEVYLALSQCRDFGFKDQIQRSAISVMSNIAEGFDRGSNKELIQFLVIARGSASEVKSLCYAALDIEYIDAIRFKSITEKCSKITNLINGFIRYLRSSERKS